MEIIDNLNWKFTFGKHKDKTVIEALESNPTCSSSGIIDIYGNRHGQGVKFAISGSLIQYLEWAEKENILYVQPKTWEDINSYDSHYTTIECYENGSKEITADTYKECLEKINVLRNVFDSKSIKPNQESIRISFWNINLNRVRITAKISFAEDKSVVYLITDYLEAIPHILVGELYDDIQFIDKSQDGDLIEIEVYIWDLNPNLTLEDVDIREVEMKAIADAKGFVYMPQSCANARMALQNRNSRDESLKKQTKSLMLAEWF